MEPQSVTPSLADQLAGVTARGRLLAEYDSAAWHSADAFRATHPAEDDVEGYVAQKTDKGWIVVYGKLAQNRERYLIAYKATQGDAPEKFDVKKLDSPLDDTGFYWKAALALETVHKDFHGEKRPYNFSVLTTDSGQFYVYVLPAQTVEKVCPFGGDVRYFISADGLDIIDRIQLHKTILEFDYRNPKMKVLGGFHTDTLSDIPVETDVFLVLTRRPLMPEFVAARGHSFQVKVDGTIAPQK